MQFVLASHNQKKLAELSDILRGLNLSILPLPEGAPEPVEDGDSFEANARIKARAAFEYTGLPAIADDSGLVVDALNGAPGVRSARYCPGSDADRNAFLLEHLAGVDDCERQARFVCAICCVLPDGQEITVRGECEGEILDEPHGTGGFGYDPLFYSKDLQMTFAEADAESKNRVSHRARAIQLLLEKLESEE